MDRLLNFAIGFILLATFVLFANGEEHVQFLIGFAASLVICMIGFVMAWLTLDGAEAAFVTGITAFGLGGWPAAVIILTFFATGSLLTRIGSISMSKTYVMDPVRRRRRRDGIQVWANSFWFVFFVILWFIFDQHVLLIPALIALATSMADTWASEIGYRFTTSGTFTVKGGRVQPGTDGGISLLGTLAALAGSAIAGLLSYKMYHSISLSSGILITIFGFAGCQIDSILGTYFQYEGHTLKLNRIGLDNYSLDNDGVNWVSTGLASIFSLILIYLTSLV